MVNENDGDLNALVQQFKANAAIKSLAKQMLIILEDIKAHSNRSTNKMKVEFPEMESVINATNFFDDNCYSHYRKKILDTANDGIRSLNISIISKEK